MTNRDDDLPWPEDAIEVARIVDAWGVKGWVRVDPYARDPKAVFASRRWFIQPPAGRPRPAGVPALPRTLCVAQVKEHGEGVVASVEEVTDRAAAEALKGARIFVSRASFPSAAQDEYYWVDLIGLEVVNRAGLVLGTVIDLLDTGAHSVLRVQIPDAHPAPGVPDASVETEVGTGGGRRARKAASSEPTERLIPFVAAYVDEVRLAERRILVDWEPDY